MNIPNLSTRGPRSKGSAAVPPGVSTFGTAEAAALYQGMASAVPPIRRKEWGFSP